MSDGQGKSRTAWVVPITVAVIAAAASIVVALIGRGGDKSGAASDPANTKPSGAPAMTIDRDHLDFGSVPKGSTKTLNVTIKNSGTADLQIASIAVNGAADFHTSGCDGHTVAPDSSCQVIVTF